jgi:hypothetical protein
MSKAKQSKSADEASALLDELRGDSQDTPIIRLISRLRAARMMSSAMEKQGINLNWSVVYRGLCEEWADARLIRDTMPGAPQVPDEPAAVEITCGAAERNAIDRLIV